MTDIQTNNQTKKTGITKEHTQIAKGLGILLMVYHHLFVIPEKLGNNYISFINLSGLDLQSIFANFAKICLCIFVFCSGIGLYYSLIEIRSLKDMYKKVLVHGLKFLMNFWLILIFIFPIGLYIHYLDFNIRTIILLITASFGSFYEWWFVHLYLLLLLISPIIVRLFQSIDVIKKIIPVIILFLILILDKVFLNLPLNENGILIKIVRFVDHLNNFDCVITFIVGIMCGCFNIIYYYQRNIGYKRWLLCIISIFVAYYTRLVFSNSPKSTNVDFIVVPLLILPLMTLFYNTKIGTVLQYFAKHSTNIWLTHTFWCYYFGQRIVLLPKYSILIYLWLLILSLLGSYIINLLYIPINNLLFNKLHKLSYKGYFYKNI